MPHMTGVLQSVATSFSEGIGVEEGEVGWPSLLGIHMNAYKLIGLMMKLSLCG